MGGVACKIKTEKGTPARKLNVSTRMTSTPMEVEAAEPGLSRVTEPQSRYSREGSVIKSMEKCRIETPEISKIVEVASTYEVMEVVQLDDTIPMEYPVDGEPWIQEKTTVQIRKTELTKDNVKQHSPN